VASCPLPPGERILFSVALCGSATVGASVNSVLRLLMTYNLISLFDIPFKWRRRSLKRSILCVDFMNWRVQEEGQRPEGECMSAFED